jgi:hypothetical protein
VAILMLACALPAFAAAPAKNAPRLESLQIDLWPEYDRPAVLVMLKSMLAKEVALPAAVALRIPAASGGPSAVAHAGAEKGELLNLPYERSDAKDYITLRFNVPNRYFHVEFYDPLATQASERRYRYAWPGDLAADKVSVVVQEPAQSSNFSVKPAMDEATTGPDGLRYRRGQLGAFKPGSASAVEISYAKPDARTSTEILKPAASAPPATTGALPAKQDSTQLLLALGVILPLLLAGLTGFLWWRQRPERSQASGVGRFCTQCGSRAAAGDRFCAKCGAALG